MVFNSFAVLIGSRILGILALVEVTALFVWGPGKGKPKELKEDLLRIFKSLTGKENKTANQA